MLFFFSVTTMFCTELLCLMAFLWHAISKLLNNLPAEKITAL